MPPGTDPPALPSSLAPLPGESLPGYLLRLSWRLGRAPARVAELCGLAQGPGRLIPVDQLIELPPGAAARFSGAAGLAVGEAEGLTLAGYRHAYPALTPRSSSESITVAYGNTWAASLSSRHCPECLAEEARRPGGSFGGTWKLAWHLPVVFACTTHGRLLQHACPACGRMPADSSRGRPALITRPLTSGIHPHQCRHPDSPAGETRHRRGQPSCPGRLDQPPGPPGDFLPRGDLRRLLSLQDTISRRLASGNAGNASAEYFADLTATIRLLILSWPEGAGLAGSQELASLIGEHAGPASKDLATPGSPGHPRRVRRDVNIWGPPRPPAQCGALILAANSVITASDPAELRSRVQELARAAARVHPEAFRNIRTMDLSPGYRRAIAPRGPGIRHVAGHPRLLPPSRECQFTIEEVPPLLPLQWHDDYLAEFTPRLPGQTRWTRRHLRRLVPLKLAEMAIGGTWKQNAEHLGIPPGAVKRTLTELRQQIGQAGLWDEFDSIVEQIARNLDEDSQRANYTARRRALENWNIPARHWTSICTDAHPAADMQRMQPMPPALGTVLIWENAAQADYLHSPLLTRMRRDGTSALLSSKISVLKTPAARAGARLVILERTAKYAALLARQCDTDAGTDIDIDTLRPWDTT